MTYVVFREITRENLLEYFSWMVKAGFNLSHKYNTVKEMREHF
jgi:hypothetical protein